ncbi:MAG: glucose 1-dehydrogenase [Verrucomicrobia bacterium]|nr:glucose 1-dehydrogenase [Verrucomicrobiota bacterium]
MNDTLFSVRNLVVLVSGGSRGIGKAIASGFAERGAQVIISGRDEETLRSTASEIGKTKSVSHRICDVASASSINRLVASVIEEFGRIDTLINVAGVNRRKPTLELEEADYDFIMDINLKGAWLLSKEVARHMVSAGSGSQINITSLNNERPVKNVAPYAMSKAAMGHMTRSLAMEWGPSGVRVNALAPGFVLTDLTKKLWSIPVMKDWVIPNTPLRRLGQPADMIGAAVFLASAASEWMTGQIVYVDGGFTAGYNWPIPEGGGQ